MSEAMNSSGERPGRSSHGGVEPAEGAVRSGGDSSVDWSADGDDDLLLRRRDGRGAVKAVVVAMVERRTTVVNFMVDLLIRKKREQVTWPVIQHSTFRNEMAFHQQSIRLQENKGGILILKINRKVR
jgi:hypothetical protein